MEISEQFVYEGADVEEVFQLITDVEFRTESSIAQHSLDQEVSVEEDDETTTVHIKRTLPADMPDFVKKITGDTVKVEQTETWFEPDEEGARSAEIAVDIVGQPASMRGTSWLFADGDSTILTIEGKVKVSIPLIGRKIEAEVAKAILASLIKEVELGTERLA